LWDRLDNLQDAAEQDAPHFWFIYHNLLNDLLGHYCRFSGYPEIKTYQALKIFSDQTTRDKYLLPVFPDEHFQGMMEQALVESDQPQALRLYERLTQHVLERMSGFEIDGWKVRSPVSY
jgi:hypothetical protein